MTERKGGAFRGFKRIWGRARVPRLAAGPKGRSHPGCCLQALDIHELLLNDRGERSAERNPHLPARTEASAFADESGFSFGKVLPDFGGLIAADDEVTGVAGALAVDEDDYFVAGLGTGNGTDLFEVDDEASDSYEIRH